MAGAHRTFSSASPSLLHDRPAAADGLNFNGSAAAPHAAWSEQRGSELADARPPAGGSRRPLSGVRGSVVGGSAQPELLGHQFADQANPRAFGAPSSSPRALGRAAVAGVLQPALLGSRFAVDAQETTRRERPTERRAAHAAERGSVQSAPLSEAHAASARPSSGRTAAAFEPSSGSSLATNRLQEARDAYRRARMRASYEHG